MELLTATNQIPKPFIPLTALTTQLQQSYTQQKSKRNRFIYSDAHLNSRNQKLYRVWVNTMHRCLNTHNNKYIEYGAKGITICNSWQSFNTFEIWAYENGYREGLALIRYNNNGDYKPENCIWDVKNNYRKIQNDYNSKHVVAPTNN